MNIKDFKDSLEYLLAAQLTPFVWGHAGIGKSTVVKQYAQSKGYKFFPFYLGTQSDIGDILGLASFVKDKNGSEVATQFATPLWLKDTIEYCENNPKSGAIIFLDEFNRARRDILNGMFSLALDKTFHMIKLPSNCHVIAAGNPPTEEYFVTDVNETALMARFAHIKLEPTFQEWVDYAEKNGIERSLIDFLKEQPALLEDTKSEFVLPVKVDRRSVERLSRLFRLKTPAHLMEQLMVGIIGVERTVAYNLYLKNTEKPLTHTQVLDGNHIDTVKAWSVAGNVKASYISITCDNLCKYINGLPPAARLTETESDSLLAFIAACPKECAYTTIRNLLEIRSNAFTHFSTHAKYEKILIDLIKDVKGAK